MLTDGLLVQVQVLVLVLVLIGVEKKKIEGKKCVPPAFSSEPLVKKAV
jgi:hypothetical protein